MLKRNDGKWEVFLYLVVEKGNHGKCSFQVKSLVYEVYRLFGWVQKEKDRKWEVDPPRPTKNSSHTKRKSELKMFIASKLLINFNYNFLIIFWCNKGIIINSL